MRQLTYTNPCDTPDFFNVPPTTLTTITNALGSGVIITTKFGALLSDKVSGGDNYSKCNPARTYSIAAHPSNVNFDNY